MEGGWRIRRCTYLVDDAYANRLCPLAQRESRVLVPILVTEVFGMTCETVDRGSAVRGTSGEGNVEGRWRGGCGGGEGGSSERKQRQEGIRNHGRREREGEDALGAGKGPISAGERKAMAM